MAGQTTILAGLAATGNTQAEALTRYWPVFGGPRASSTEPVCEMPIRDACTIKNLSTYLSANGVNAANSAVFTVRKSAADTSVTVSYSALQTGRKQDTANTASFADGDEIDVKCVTADPAGSGTTITLNSISVELEPTATATCLSPIGCFSVGTTFSTENATRYVGLFGAYAPQTSEAQCECRAWRNATLRDFWVQVTANARGSTTTFHLRKNGADGAQSVAYTSLQTGLKEDSSNSDAVSPGDTFCAAFTTTTGTTTITIAHMGVWMASAEGLGMMVGGNSTGASFSSGATNYVPVGGNVSSGVTTEANAEHIPKSGLVAKDLQTYVSANTLNNDCVVTLRDNGADSSLAVTYATGQTGWKIDSDETTLADADEFSAKVVTTAAGSGSITLHSVGITTLVAFDRTMTPAAASLAASDGGQGLGVDYPIAAGTVSVTGATPTPAVVLGDIFPYVTPHGAVDLVPVGPTLAHGGISLAQAAGAVSLSGPTCSVSHGEARRAIGAGETSVSALVPSLAFGAATVAAPTASVGVSAPAPNLAIDVALSVGAATVGVSPIAPVAAMGEKVLTPDPAGFTSSAPAAATPTTLGVDITPVRIDLEAVRASVSLVNDLAQVAPSLSMTGPAPTLSTALTVAVDAAGVGVGAPSPTVPAWSKILPMGVATILARGASPTRSPETLAQTTGAMIECLVAAEVVAECLVSPMAVAACLVSPESVAATAKNNQTWETSIPEEAI